GVPGAWLGAALWALHPVQVESVAWISELKNTQSAVFFLSAVWWFLGWSDSEGRRDCYVSALVCAVFAVLSKPSAVMLPIALALCVWWRRGTVRRRDILVLAPFFALSAIVSGWTIWEQKFHSGAVGVEWNQTFPERLAIAGRAVWFYLGSLVWPDSLNFIYPRWEIDAVRPLAFLPLAAALGVAVFLWHRRNGWLRPVFFAAAFFVALLFPVLGFFNIYFFRYSFVSDHFQYLASIGPVALAGAAVVRLAPRRAVAVASAILIVFAGLTWCHSTDFTDNETLWRTTLARNATANMAWLNLGASLAKQGRDDEAISSFLRAAAIRPDDAEARNDAGWGLIAAGYPAAAIPLLEHVLRFKPEHAEAHNNLGNALRKLGRLEEALTHYARSLELRPNSADARNNLGGALAGLARLPEAISQFENALRLAPDFVPAQANLGTALGLAGRWADAVGPLQEAARLQPDYPDAQAKLAVALANTGRPGEAVLHFENALRQNRDAAEIHRNFGQVLESLGRTREAAEHFDAATRRQRGR
ncbi:MAG: tetratricopeptide repeat protein, partial [Opitutus sp.]|nr:tetratricopeptide repeat protein [Opitutus sp.]